MLPVKNLMPAKNQHDRGFWIYIVLLLYLFEQLNKQASTDNLSLQDIITQS